MGDTASYFLIALGVIVAVLYPVILGKIRGAFPRVAAPGLPDWAKKYLLLLIFSLVTALIVLAAYRASHPDTVLAWYDAFLLGFGWESTVEKLIYPPKKHEQPAGHPAQAGLQPPVQP